MLLVVADDDRDSAETLAELLRILAPPPVQVLVAFDGQAALEAVTGCTPPPDAVIMDIEMPRMDGVNAALEIRSVLGSAAPTLIAVTAYVGLPKMASVRRAFDHALMKPLKVDELLGLLQAL